MKTILVTGGAGYIGSHTVVDLLENNYNVVIIDNFSNSKPKVLENIKKITNKDFKFYEGDVQDKKLLEKIFTENKIEGVIHFAALKAVGESVEKPLEYYHNNLFSTITLLEVMKKYNSKNFIFSSSATVYGNPKSLPILENFEINHATNPYGETKIINERILRDLYNSDHTWNIALLRYFNPVGAHPSAEIGELPRGVPQNLLPYVCQAAMGIRKELSVFGDDYNTPDGSCVRDYIDVIDLARAHVCALNRMVEGKSAEKVEYYNLGTGHGVSVFELVNTFMEATGVKVPYKVVGRREGDIERIYGNPSHANEVLGWKAEVPLKETLANAWRWQEKLREKGVM